MPGNPKTNIDKNSGYTVVYPEGSVNSAAYPAVQLANALSLTLSTESAGDSAKEIVIIDENLGKELTTPTGKYNVKRDGNKIIITAGDMFGFVGATEFITEKLIKNGTMSFFETLNYNGTYTGDMRETREGTNRVMFHNMWFQDPAHAGMPQNEVHFRKTAGSSIEYELALVAAYQPDVIGFNEYWYGYRLLLNEAETMPAFVERMEKMGYVFLTVGESVTDEGNILFYDPEKVTFTQGSLKYIHYGKMYDEEAKFYHPETNPSPPGYGYADPYPEGHALAGKWYDTNVKSASGAIIANFTDNTTQKSFTVCCTHFESNGQIDPNLYPQVGPMGNAYRCEQGETLLKELKIYRQNYDAPIILGGDYNSQDSYKAGDYSANGKTITVTAVETDKLRGVCDVLRDGGFVNAYTEAMEYDATNAAQACSTHGYPIWNAALERFVNYNSSLTASANSYVASIDHIYVYDTNDVIEECDYWNIIDKPVLCASDHKAILLDFNID